VQNVSAAQNGILYIDRLKHLFIKKALQLFAN